MSLWESYRESLSYRFSASQKAELAAALPKRKTAEFLRKYRNETPAKLDALWVVVGEVFLEDVETAVGVYFDPRMPRDGLPRRQLRDEMRAISTHARQIRLALERLSERDSLILSSKLFVSLLGMGLMPPPGTKDPRSLILLVLEVIKTLEDGSVKLSDETLKSGPDKSDSYEAATFIVTSYETYFGKSSASPNGALFRIINTLKDVTGLTIGEDLLRRAIKESARFRATDGGLIEKT